MLERSLPLVVLVLTTSTACKRHEPIDLETGLAEAAVDSSTVGLDEGNLLATALDGAPVGGAGATAEDVAAYIAGHVPTVYTPPACITTTQDGAKVTAVFAGCTGPFGLVGVDGTVVFTVRPSATSVAVDATADGLIVGDAVLDLDATAIYRTTGSASSIDVTTRTTAIGERGHELTHTGDYTASWDATCASIDGAWSTSVEDLARSTTASLERCRGACPTGTITRVTVDGRTIAVDFDGSAIATWTSSTGRGGRIALVCGL